MSLQKGMERIVFYRDKHNPDYYIIYFGIYRGSPEMVLQMMTHTGECCDSGYPHVDVELAYIFDFAKRDKDLITKFLDYIVTHVATDHISISVYDCVTCKAWIKLETYEPEKWLKDFDDHQNAKMEEYRRASQEGQQLTLF